MEQKIISLNCVIRQKEETDQGESWAARRFGLRKQSPLKSIQKHSWAIKLTLIVNMYFPIRHLYWRSGKLTFAC